MLHDLIASTGAGERILEWIEVASLAIEILVAANIIRTVALESTGTTRAGE